jgi:dTDP-4-dehydrorhamnose 3,5-epimerase
MKFTFEALVIPEVVLITHEIFRDARGFFAESFREEPFLEAGIPRFVQDNHSRSPENVLRGLHYQIQPAGVGKLVRCLRGRIYDVAVDIRKGSPTYGKWLGVELTDANCQMMYVPEGFAHGFCSLSSECEVFYKMTNYYSPEYDRVIRWNDPQIGIKWPVVEPMLSDKDRRAPLLADADNNFTYER